MLAGEVGIITQGGKHCSVIDSTFTHCVPLCVLGTGNKAMNKDLCPELRTNKLVRKIYGILEVKTLRRKIKAANGIRGYKLCMCCGHTECGVG